MANIFVAATATWNGKALGKGKKDLNAFEQSANKLNKTLGRTFAVGAILAFSKKAINAFAADEQAAKSLAVQLENTGNGFRVGEVERYIAKLQDLYGVLDDQLRPAFQTLLNATGSVTLSQKALETALNVSAGTGKDLNEVVMAIAKGASGTTTSLQRLGTGLDKATLATGDMNKIMSALDKKFAGQAQARLSTYAGKMDLLKVGAANATETIGKGLLDALTLLGKDNSINQAADSMNSFALAIANTTKGMAQLIGEVKKMVDSDVGKFLLAITALLTLGKKQLILGAAGLIAYDIGKNPKPISDAENRTIGQKRLADRIKESKLIKDSTLYRTAENAQLAKKTQLDILKDKFDVERIGLMAALNSATDEETKLRIRAQLAILDNNEALAKKYNAELDSTKAINEFANAAVDAAKRIGNIDYTVPKGNPLVPTTPLSYMNNFPSPSTPSTQAIGNIDYTVPISTGQSQYMTPMSYADVRLTVDTSSTADEFANLVARSIQLVNKTGISTGISGAN